MSVALDEARRLDLALQVLSRRSTAGRGDARIEFAHRVFFVHFTTAQPRPTRPRSRGAAASELCQTAKMRSGLAAKRRNPPYRHVSRHGIRRVSLRSTHPTEKKKGKRNAGRRNVSCPHASGVRYTPRKGGLRRPPLAGALACRRSTAVLAKGTAHPQGSASGQASRDAAGAFGPVRPPQPGGGDLALLHGRYPRRKKPVPVQRCTSRAGRSAGRLMPEAARKRGVNPPAGAALAPPPGLPPEGVLSSSEV